MKICSKCGAQQSDNRVFCIDCGEKLGKTISKDDEEKLEKRVKQKIDKMYKDSDPLYVSLRDKIIGYSGLAVVVLTILLMIIFNDNEYVFIAGLFSIMFLLASSINSLIPKIIWEFEKLRLSFTISSTDDIQPSDFYTYCRKFSVWLFFIIGLLLFIYLIISIIYPNTNLFNIF